MHWGEFRSACSREAFVPDIDLAGLLRTLADNEGSDLHLKVGSPPIIRVDGALRRLEQPRLTPQDTQLLASQVMPPDRRGWLEQKRETDFALSVPGVGRFRANVFYQRGSITLVLRRVRVGSQTYEELGLPPIISQLADAPRGLILITGPTGSGKTTTLAAIIDQINGTKPVHIVTIEEPIEVLHPDRVATVNQREVGMDTESYSAAMRSVVRQDPDVILIGEMRDPDTVWAALAAGETGHLVLSTLHTSDSVETVNRVVDFFPSYQQHQIRVTLASVLRGVVCMRLVPRAGGGRIPAVEVLINNGRVADRILDSNRTSEIHEVIADGEYYGMQTFDQSLLSLVRQELVTVDEALRAASQPHDFLLMLEQAGLRVASP
jgi:twitching motility protein PilT